jgi:hypothetical protein
MKKVAFMLLAMAALVISGKCGYALDQAVSVLINRFDAAMRLQVPMPLNTPFDSYQKAKETYLKAYEEGYRTTYAEAQVNFGVKKTKEYMDGWHAGIAAATKDHPEKVAEMKRIIEVTKGLKNGIYSLDDVKKLLPQSYPVHTQY